MDNKKLDTQSTNETDKSDFSPWDIVRGFTKPTSTERENSPETTTKYDKLLDDSASRLKERYDFSLDAALQAGGREFSSSEVTKQAESLAQDLQLEAGFFDDDVCSIALMMVAESTVAIEEIPDDEKDSEKNMLMDVLLAAGGAKYSPKIKKLAESDNKLHQRYFETDEESLLWRERNEFFDANVDVELSASVLDAMKNSELLAETRTMLDLTTDTEKPFSVKVVKIAKNSYMLKKLGVFGDGISNERIKELMRPYEETARTYSEKFEDQYGEFLAFSSTESNTIYMSPQHAYSILPSETIGDFKRGEIDQDIMMRESASVKHEYAHTQRSMLRGAHAQLGLALEERKAEMVSGDEQGYNDIKSLFLDGSYVTNYNLIRRLEESIKTENPLASYMAKVSGAIGMRSALLMAAMTPPAYESDKEMSANFADLTYLRKDGEMSSVDMIVGQLIDRFGDDGLRKMVDKYGDDINRLQGFLGVSSVNKIDIYRQRLLKEKISKLENTM